MYHKSNRLYILITILGESLNIIPENAIKCGTIDDDQKPVYIGKAFHEGDLLPANILPHKKHAIVVTFENGEYRKTEYDYLCAPPNSIEWVPFSDQITNAVVGGRNMYNKDIYIGRVEHCGTLVAGRIDPSENVLHIAWNGAVIPFAQFEVLVSK